MTFPLQKTLDIVKYALSRDNTNYHELKTYTTDEMFIACRDMIRYIIKSDNDEIKKQVYMELIATIEGVVLNG